MLIPLGAYKNKNKCCTPAGLPRHRARKLPERERSLDRSTPDGQETLAPWDQRACRERGLLALTLATWRWTPTDAAAKQKVVNLPSV